MNMRRCFLAVLAVFVCLSLFGQSQGRRFALVIGNGDYRNIERLMNPVNGAQDIAAKLWGMGFEVDMRTNLDNAGMGRAAADYTQRPAGIPPTRASSGMGGPGHGVQIDGENHLLLSLEQSARNKLNVMVLDACRNNPFRSLSGDGRNVGRGLTVVNNISHSCQFRSRIRF
jgi:uncharacterized caspase-like protein